jgi:signal peptidase I
MHGSRERIVSRLPQTAARDLNALKCELADEILRSSGSLRLRVTGWSMLPTVMPGDTLLIERIDSDAVAEGDIVLYGRDRRFFVHRVVTKCQSQKAEFVTRGDAMPAPDPPVPESDLLGRVSFILRNGKCIEPRRTLRLPERAVAAVVQRSTFAARVVVGVHGMGQNSQSAFSIQASSVQASWVQASQIQESQIQTSQVTTK